MQIHVYKDDLVYDYDGKPEKAELSDFPSLADIIFNPSDCVVFHWGSEQKILLQPSDEWPSVLNKFGKNGTYTITNGENHVWKRQR
jgi:hypothetical protein